MIEEDIIATVKADTTIDSYIDGRIYPNQIVQGNTFPMIALLVNESHPINGQVGICMREYDFLMSISSIKYSDCRNIGERLITIFDRFSGMLGNSKVSQCIYTGTPLNALENDTNLYHIGYEFNILININ